MKSIKLQLSFDCPLNISQSFAKKHAPKTSRRSVRKLQNAQHYKIAVDFPAMLYTTLTSPHQREDKLQ